MSKSATQWYSDVQNYERRLKQAALQVMTQNTIYSQLLSAQGININSNTSLSSPDFKKALFTVMTPFQFSQQEYDKLYNSMSSYFNSNASALKKLKKVAPEACADLTEDMFKAANLNPANYSYAEAQVVVYDAMDQFKSSIKDMNLRKQQTEKELQIDWTTKGFVNELVYQALDNKKAQEDLIQDVYAIILGTDASTLKVKQNKTLHPKGGDNDYGHDLEWLIYRTPAVEEIAQGLQTETYQLLGDVKTSFRDGTGIGIERSRYYLTEEVRDAILQTSTINTLDTKLIREYNRDLAKHNILLFDYLQKDYPSTLITLQKEAQEVWFLGDMIEDNLIYLDPAGLNLITENIYGYTNYYLTYAKGKLR